MNETEAPEQQMQGAKNIALSIFRFRARRGIGVFYSLFSIIPLLSYYLEAIAASQTLSLVVMGTAILLVWIASRMAGFRAFSQMTESIDLVNAGGQNEPDRKSISIAGLHLLRSLPFVALIVSLYIGSVSFAELFLFVGVFDQLFYSILRYSRRSTDAVVRLKVEDYVVLATVVVYLILSFIPGTGHLTGFGYLSLVFLLCGVKSMYDAPEEIIQTS
jgi:hypothetical protein